MHAGFRRWPAQLIAATLAVAVPAATAIAQPATAGRVVDKKKAAKPEARAAIRRLLARTS